MKKKKTKKLSKVGKIMAKVSQWSFVVWFIVSISFQIGEVVFEIYEYYRLKNPVQTSITVENGHFEEKQVPVFKKKDFVGTCTTGVFEVDLKVYVTSDNLPTGVEGRFRWDSSNNPTITLLKGTNYVNVVAHEVSHFVDYVVRMKGINDTETRAYLQGYLTECVTKLIPKT